MAVAGHRAGLRDEYVSGESLRLVQRKDSLDMIVLSGRGFERYSADALESVASDYVVKPFRPIELIARIKRFIRPHEKSHESIISIVNRKFFHEIGTVISGRRIPRPFSNANT